MKKTLILSLALLLALPVIVGAQDSRPENRPEGRRPEGRALGRQLAPIANRLATGTEAWQKKTQEYRDQIKNERENRWQGASTTSSTTVRGLGKPGLGLGRENDEGSKIKPRGERVRLFADYLLQRLERQIDKYILMGVKVQDV
ncbi:MAG: hypothetical protein AAB900_02230, partial [Patescibacteria group bacterium]